MRFGTYFLLLVSAVHICFCESAVVSSHDNVTKSIVVKLKKHHTNKTNNCKQINCPTKEEAKCIKLKNKKGYNSKEVYVVVLNKCEIDYIKCHEGLEANLVPMKNCDHKATIESRVTEKARLKRSSNITRKKSKNKLSKQPRRHQSPNNKNKIDYGALYFGPKRRDNSNEDSEDEVVSVEPVSSELTESEEIVNVYVENDMPGHKEVISYRVDTDDNSVDTLDGPVPEDLNNDDKDNEIDTDEDMDREDLKETETEEEPGLVNLANFSQEDGKIEGIHIQYVPDDFAKTLSASIEIVNRNAQVDANAKIVDDETSTGEMEEARDREKNESQVNGNLSGKSSDEHSDQYFSDCPTECPAREVMVCARCKEGVYRTFLSVCHLRLFSCKHPDEKLELVSRRPCVLSAPFLTGMKTKGRMVDPNDEDVILKYIRCREKGDTDDSKCKYANIETEDAK